jgi:hypothetical protein
MTSNALTMEDHGDMGKSEKENKAGNGVESQEIYGKLILHPKH